MANHSESFVRSFDVVPLVPFVSVCEYNMIVISFRYFTLGTRKFSVTVGRVRRVSHSHIIINISQNHESVGSLIR